MNTFASAAARIVGSVSELLHKPLELADPQSMEGAGAFAIRLAIPRIAIVAKATDSRLSRQH